MSINNEKQDNPDYSFILGVGFLTFIVYSYFLYSQDQFGYMAAAGFFILYTAEHLYNFINRTDGKLNKYAGTSIQRLIAFGVPSIVLLLTWLVSGAI